VGNLTNIFPVLDFNRTSRSIQCDENHEIECTDGQRTEVLSLKNLNLEGLSLQRGTVKILDSINLSLKKGEILLITGASGSGKTSLAMTITGLIPQHYPGQVDGTISINGLSPETVSVEQLSREVACVLTDSWNRFFQINVFEEIAFGPRNLGCHPERVSEIVHRMAHIFDLEQLIYRRLDTLSHGQLQRVTLAGAFAMGADYVILDEPSMCLDRHAMALLCRHLEYCRKTKSTGILLLEHRLTEFLNFVNTVMIMDHGRVVFRESEPVFRQRAHDLAQSFGIRYPGYQAPRSWASEITPFTDPEPTPIITLKDVSVEFDTPVLRNISCSIYPGISALTGPNGGGKSTLAGVIAGIVKPRHGKVNITVSAPNGRGPDGRVVGLLPQDASSMLFNRTVYEEIAEGLRNYGISNWHEKTLKWIDIIDLKDKADWDPMHLSNGQIIRVAAAAVMALEPEILILDEPSRGQDWKHLEAILTFTLSAASSMVFSSIKSCIIITHDYKIIHRFADYLLEMDNGRIIAYGLLQKAHDA